MKKLTPILLVMFMTLAWGCPKPAAVPDETTDAAAPAAGTTGADKPADKPDVGAAEAKPAADAKSPDAGAGKPE